MPYSSLEIMNMLLLSDTAFVFDHSQLVFLDFSAIQQEEK
jgi:hypothetical protein